MNLISTLLRVLSTMVLLATQTAMAQEESGVESTSLEPSLELLEYLGSMVETDGELVGPDSFEEHKLTDDEPRDVWVSREDKFDE